MARKRERYTERTRPHRKDTGGGGPVNIEGEGWKNPMVLIAIGALVVAVVMVVGFMVGRDTTTTQTAAQDASEKALEEGEIPTIPIPTIDMPTIEVTGEEGAEAPDEAAATAEGEGADEETAPEGEAAAGGEQGEGADEATGTEGEDAASDTAKGEEIVLSLPGSGTPYEAPDDMGLEAGKKAYFATIETERGPIVVELWPEVAPAHVNSFAFLAEDGFFDGLTFHRVVDGFVIQGGDPNGDGSGGPGYRLPAEFNADNPVPHRVGTLAMARSSDEDSAGSQFYIVLADSPSATALDGKYTVFGHVIEGMDTVLAIREGDVIESVEFEEKDISERVVGPDDVRAGELPQDVLDTVEGD